ncbi:MAG: hypothetical protein ACI8S6_003305 [Myxococcota bacterium]|jgi:hypothetical protein
MAAHSTVGRLARSTMTALIASSVPMVLGCGGMLAVVLPMYEGECNMMGPAQPCTLLQWLGQDVLGNSFFWVLLGVPGLGLLLVSGLLALITFGITWLLLGRRTE